MAKGYFTKDYAVYIAVKIASIVVSFIPLVLALWIGKVVGLCMYHLHHKRKRIGYANLKAAFCKSKSPSELKEILKRTYKNYGQTMLETIMIHRIDRRYIKRYITLEGKSRFDEAHARNKGVIFLTSHFGSWELTGLKSAQEGYPVYIFARPQKWERLHSLFNSYRERLGCKVIERGMSSREVIKALRGGKIVGIISDQDVGSSGIFIDLLGRPASHAVGTMRFARDTAAAVLPVFIIRQGGPNHLLRLEEPIIVPKTADRDADIRYGLEKDIKILESYMTRYPDQWMWIYTRWKSTPVRKAVILNDKKQGHLNQSKAALNVIKRCRRDADFKDEDTEVEIIDIRFKSRLRRFLLSLCAIFASHACQGCMKCLEFALDSESYKKVMETYADIVISCGSSLGAVNVLLSKENNAKNVVIMKPSVLTPLGKFEVAIIPKHDRPKKRWNVAITDGSPNIINEETMRDGGDRLRGFVTLSGKKVLGLLLGGESREYRITAGLVNELIGQIEAALNAFDMELLVTTSRRTPKDVEGILKSRLKDNPRCKFLVIANEKNIENAVGGILDLSEVVLVSGESISMVSEAASSGKKTIVFDVIKKKAAFTKHEYAIKNLSRLNYIAKTPVNRICQTITELVQNKKQLERLDDARKMYEKLYRII